MTWLSIPLWILCSALTIVSLKDYYSAATTVRRAIEESAESARTSHIRRWALETASACAGAAGVGGLAVLASTGYLQPTVASLAEAAGVAIVAAALVLILMPLYLDSMARSSLGLYSAPTSSRPASVTLYPPFRHVFVRVLSVLTVGIATIALSNLLLLRPASEGTRALVLGLVLILTLGVCAWQYWRFTREEVVLTKDALVQLMGGRHPSEVGVRASRQSSQAPWRSGTVQITGAGGEVIREYRVSSSGDVANAISLLLRET